MRRFFGRALRMSVQAPMTRAVAAQAQPIGARAPSLHLQVMGNDQVGQPVQVTPQSPRGRDLLPHDEAVENFLSIAALFGDLRTAGRWHLCGYLSTLPRQSPRTSPWRDCARRAQLLHSWNPPLEVARPGAGVPPGASSVWTRRATLSLGPEVGHGAKRCRPSGRSQPPIDPQPVAQKGGINPCVDSLTYACSSLPWQW